ncbi:hypothetical protein ACJJIO_06320 [Microbulbifer sp. TRSA005]
MHLNSTGKKRLVEDESISFHDSKLIAKCLARFGGVETPSGVSNENLGISLSKEKNNNMVTLSTSKIYGWGLRCFVNNDLEVLSVQ